MSDDRKQREKDFHDDRFGKGEFGRKDAAKFYSIIEDARSYYKNLILALCKGKRLLEYGCGTGDYPILWAKNGAIVTGIDIFTGRN